MAAVRQHIWASALGSLVLGFLYAPILVLILFSFNDGRTLSSWQGWTLKWYVALAQDRGLDHAYSMRVLRAFFQEGRDIGDLDVLVELAGQAGLDPAEARQALDSGAYAQRHREALRHAREDMEITCVPTIVVGDRVFRGTPSMDELVQALDDLERGAGTPDRSSQAELPL